MEEFGCQQQHGCMEELPGMVGIEAAGAAIKAQRDLGRTGDQNLVWGLGCSPACKNID